MYVWLSTGSGYSPPTRWAQNGADLGGPRYTLGDFNGDGKTDVISFETNKAIFAWISTGTAFNAPVQWAVNGADIPDRYKVGDFDGDREVGRDLVRDQRRALRLKSTGTAFNAASLWRQNGADIGAARYQVGKSDLGLTDDVVSSETNGGLYSWLSTGTGFSAPAQWGTNSDAVQRLTYSAEGARLRREELNLSQQVVDQVLYLDGMEIRKPAAGPLEYTRY